MSKVAEMMRPDDYVTDERIKRVQIYSDDKRRETEELELTTQ